jgi:hypothetical protein
VNKKTIDRFLTPASTSDPSAAFAEPLLSVRPHRAPTARFLTRNEEWATMAIRARRFTSGR